MTSNKEKSISSMVEEAYVTSRDDSFRNYKFEVWERCYKNWRGLLEVVIPKRSNLFIPITMQTVETMVAREMSAIFNENKMLFRYEPRKASDVTDAETLTEFANYDFNRIPHVYRKFRSFLTMIHVYGTAIIRPFWDFKYYLEDFYNEANAKTEKTMNIVRDQFNMDIVTPRNFFPDPAAKTIDEAKFVITRSLIDIDTLKQQIKMYEYSKISEEQINKIAGTATTMSDTFSEIDNHDSLIYDKNRKFVEILEYWSRDDDRFIAVAGRQKVIRDDTIPFDHKEYPFLVGVDIPDPERLWGMSTCEIISDSQNELNAYRNNRMDKANMLMNPMYKAKHGEVFDRSQLQSRPGGIIRLRDIDSLQRLDMGSMNQSDYTEEQIIKNDIQTATGISDYALGQFSNQYNQTATGISLISSNADARIITKVQYLQEEVLKPLGMMWLSMQKQFGDEKEALYVTGKKIVFDNSIKKKNYDLSITASTQMINKQIRQNQIMQLAQLVINNPNIDQKAWLKYVLETFNFPAKKLISNVNVNAIPSQQSLQGAQQPRPDGQGQIAPGETGNMTGYDFVRGESTDVK